MIAAIWSRLLSLFRRRRLEAELERDIQEHIDLATEENLKRGLAPSEATAAARRSFGSIEGMKEEHRHQRGLPILETFLRDVRLAIRSLHRDIGFAVVAIVTLALGIGVNAAIFSVTHAVILKPLPYQDPDHLMVLVLRHVQQHLERMPFSVADFLDWGSQNSVFDKYAAYGDRRFNLTDDGNPEQIIGQVVTANFFATLGAKPEIGRTFAPGADASGATPQVVVSHSLWQRRFKGDAGIIGRTILMNATPVVVAGVMPADFEFGRPGTEAWQTLILNPTARRGPYFLWVVAHRKANVSTDQAQRELRLIAQRMESSNPKDNLDTGITAIPLHDYITGDVRVPLLVLSGAVLFVLLIASANIGNLMLARVTARQQEIAVRTALGASRWRLASQFIAESLSLATTGGACGLALTSWGTRFLQQLAPSDLPRLNHVGIDPSVVLYALAATLLSAVVFGMMPVVGVTLTPIQQGLKLNSRGLTHNGRLRSMVIVSEFALCMVLLLAAGLMIKSFARLTETDAGFKPANVLAAGVTVNANKYSNDQLVIFYQQLVGRVQSLPGVAAAALSNSLPPNLLSITDSFSIEGRPWPAEQHAPIGPVLFVSPEYFQTIGIPLLRGRNFSTDDRTNTPQVTLVSQSLARQYFGNEDPIGKRIKVGGPERPKAPWMEIIGVVGDAKYSSLEGTVEPTRYSPLSQVPWIGLYLVVKTTGSPIQMVPGIRQQLSQLDPDVPLTPVRTMDQAMSRAVGQPRFRTLLLALFAALALVLATVGIYGVMSYSVTRRSKEIGIRMSLGASGIGLIRMVVREGLQLAVLGVTVGVVGGLGVTRFLGALLFEVQPTDPGTFVLLPLFLLLVAVGACLIPAYRATRVDPLGSLRTE